MVDATPAIPDSTITNVAPNPIKIATNDLKLYADQLIPIETMSDMIFEDIGGQEVISIARNDIINGQDVSYQPIKNMNGIYSQYNPQNILSLQSPSNSYFDSFQIKLENRIPSTGLGPYGQIVYLDEKTGDLLINILNLASDEEVKVQIQVSGSRFNGTI